MRNLNEDLEYHLDGIRYVLNERLPEQCDEGSIEPDKWEELHEANLWYGVYRLEMNQNVADGMGGLLNWLEGHVNQFLSWIKLHIDMGTIEDEEIHNELQKRFGDLLDEYEERAQLLLSYIL